MSIPWCKTIQAELDTVSMLPVGRLLEVTFSVTSRGPHKHTDLCTTLCPAGQVVPSFAVELLQRSPLGEMEEKQLTPTSNTEGERM